MSGWIKFDKEIPDSIRFRRVVRKVCERNALPNVTDRDEAFAKTLCLGALVRLWVYADSHIGNDNTIAATFDEIDDLVGLPGFAESLPGDWLVKIDDETVQLPDFVEHNGSSAKQRRDNARRQAEWRTRQKSKDVTQDVTARNARNAARPDKTRPDKEGAAEPLVLHASLPRDTWEEWLTHRREKRWTLSHRALKPQLELLAKYGMREQAEIIKNSMQAGWQGLFAPKGKPPQSKPDPSVGAI